MKKIFINLVLITMFIAGANTWVYASDPFTPKKSQLSGVSSNARQTTPSSQRTLTQIFGADDNDTKRGRLRESDCHNLDDVYTFLRDIDIAAALAQIAAQHPSTAFNDENKEVLKRQAQETVLAKKKAAFKAKFKAYSETESGPLYIVGSQVNKVVNDITKNEFINQWSAAFDKYTSHSTQKADNDDNDNDDNDNDDNDNDDNDNDDNDNNLKRNSGNVRENDSSVSSGSSGSTTPKNIDIDLMTGLTDGGKDALNNIFGEGSGDPKRTKLEGSGFQNTDDLSELVTFLLDFEIIPVTKPTDDLRRELQKNCEDTIKANLKEKFKSSLATERIRPSDINKLVNSITRPVYFNTWKTLHAQPADLSITNVAGAGTQPNAGGAGAGTQPNAGGAGAGNPPAKQTFFGKHRKAIIGCSALAAAGVWMYRHYSNSTRPQTARPTVPAARVR